MSLNIVIPMAGWATRLRPHTWSKPKPLVSVAGKTCLDHLLDTFHSVPDPASAEYTFIVSPFLGELQMRAYMAEYHSSLKVNYVIQADMKGQSHALYLARQHLSGPMLVIFADTLIETDFSFLARERNDIVAWVKPVPDPRRFGVAEVNQEGQVTRLIEKPQSMENNLAVVGCYYFRQGRDLLAAIKEQMRRGVLLKGEYFLVDAINIMLERGAKMRTERVDIWLDTGTTEAALETNRYLLERLQVGRLGNLQAGRAEPANLLTFKRANVRVVEPVFIHETAEIRDSVIGPYASIGPECRIVNSRVEDSILEAGAVVETAALKDSFVGRQARVRGRSADDAPMTLNIGDNSSVVL